MCAQRRIPEGTTAKPYKLVVKVWRQGGKKSGSVSGEDGTLYAKFTKEPTINALREKLRKTGLLPVSVNVPQVEGADSRGKAIEVHYVAYLKKPPIPIEQEQEEALIDGEQ